MSIKTTLISACICLIAASSAFAQKRYDPGASDTEIKFGQTVPYSGPLSAYGIRGKVQTAYFAMLNESGGINGRKLKLISLDDGYSPPKTVEMVRRLVEQDEVLFLMGIIGTPTNSAIHRYVNNKKIPHLLISTGASKWNDPKNFPWTIGFTPNYVSEARLYALDILTTRPHAKIAVLMQNDDYGKDYFRGFVDALGDKAKTMIVAHATYEVTDPTIDSQIVTLKASGADTLFNITTAKFSAQSIRKMAEIGWKPIHYLNSVSTSVGAVLEPAGLDKSQGLISMAYLKDPNDPRWENDPAMKEYFAFIKRYAQGINPYDTIATGAYAVAQLTVHILKQCGDDLTRENIMHQATNMKDVQIPMALPGVLINTSPNDYALFQKMQLVRFNGKSWIAYGDPISVK